MPRRQFAAGTTTHVLDARPDRLDLRDRLYQPPTLALPPRHPADADLQRYVGSYLQRGLVLDQGEGGACTGYGLAAVIHYLLWVRAVDHCSTDCFAPVSPAMLYDLARFYDEWPGQDYDGSSCRGAMKGWHKHGACAQALWERSIYPEPTPGRHAAYRPESGWALDAATRPLGVYYRIDRESVTDLQAAIRDVGAVYVSASVHAGWKLQPRGRRRNPPPGALSHAVLPRIAFEPGREADGAHAFALVGYNEDGFLVQNSWGTGWGLHGFAVLRYADWVEHGIDAWVCTLGVPQRVDGTPEGSPQPSTTRRGLHANLLAGDARPPVRPTAPEAQPWSSEQAYLHSVVTGNDGFVDTGRPDCADPALHIDDVAVQRVLSWAQEPGRTRPRVVVYAHGGLNSEAEAIARARVLGPYFLGNGIYPIFTAWKTGLLETLGQALADRWVPEAERLATGRWAEARDLLVESLAHGPMQWIWRQMKDNARLAARPGRGTALLAEALARLQTMVPGVEVHLVGHSAGSYVLGHLIDRGLRPASLGLYAPACTLEFALQHLVPHAPAGRTWLHLLTHQAEQDDWVVSELLYGKSLLWLVARGFEDERKTPLAGLARTLDARAGEQDDDLWHPRFWPQVQRWRDWVRSLRTVEGGAAWEEIRSIRLNRWGKTQPASHGGFDNDLRTLTRTINRIRGEAPDARPPLPVEDLEY